MKATVQYFPAVLIIMWYKYYYYVVLTFEPVDEILKVTIQMKATELPITSLDALPLSYSRLLEAKSIELGSLLGFECQ